MQLGQLQLQISSFPFKRALRDLLVLQCFDTLKRGAILVDNIKPRTLSISTCSDKNLCAASF